MFCRPSRQSLAPLVKVALLCADLPSARLRHSWGVGVTSYLRPVYSARTDAGQQRDHNEDYVHAGVLDLDSAGRPLWYVFAVADGVGGHQRGEWASQTAIETLSKEGE